MIDVVRTHRVLTNETCVHRCSFCDTRRDHERASVAGPEALAAGIDAAGAAGAEEIVLTGGEPTLRRDLPRWIARARGTGARVVLETNGAPIDAAAARAYAAAGLTLARLHVPGHHAAAAVTGDPTAWAKAGEAAALLAATGVTIEAVIPIVAATLDELDTLPAAIAKTMPAVSALRARVIQQAPGGVAAPADAIAGLERLGDAARAVPLPLQLDPATFVPPCLLRRPDRLAHAYALGPGGASRPDHHRVSACAACVVVDRCPGVPTPWRAHAEAAARSLGEERLRRRLSIVQSVDAQIARELVTDEVWRRTDGRTVRARIVRVGFACNQSCSFCFVSTHLPAAPRLDVAAAIDGIAEQGGVLVLSGGEPTLDPELAAWIRRGKAKGACEVELQTNATRLDVASVDALVDAGLDVAFVSLHAATAATSDAITGAPGTFARTLAGLDALAGRVPRLRINFVFCRANADEFPAFVDRVASRWPVAAITVSFVAPSTDLVPHTAALVPRYTEVMPALLDGLARARAHGLEIGGFDSMCGIPLCLVPAAERAPLLQLAPIPEGIDRGEFVVAPACGGCSLRGRCYGVRRGYAALHGTDELRAQDATVSC